MSEATFGFALGVICSSLIWLVVNTISLDYQLKEVCEARSGQSIRLEGKRVCIDAASLKVLK